MKSEDQTQIKTKQQLLERIATGEINSHDGVRLLKQLPDFVEESKATADFASSTPLQSSPTSTGLPFLSLQLI